MPIKKVDGRKFLDSGSVVVSGDATIEVVFENGGNGKHTVALKLRSDGGTPQVRFGNPSKSRTVVHLANFPWDIVSTSGGVDIGDMADGTPLKLAFAIEPFAQNPNSRVRFLAYTLYGDRG